MMVTGHTGGGAAMKLRKALLVYEGGDGATASIHDVEPDPQTRVPMIMPGRPLTTEALASIHQNLAGGSNKQRSLIPENLLCAESGRLIWYVPSHRRLIFFKTSKKAFDDEVDGKNALHPALLFVAEAKTLYIFALASDERPTGKTTLYNAPYFNVYERGNMCNGSGKVPGNCSPSTIPAWEKLFFDTNFSHTNRGSRHNALTSHPGGHDGLWRELVRLRGRGVHKTFPVQYLVPTDRQVKDLLNGRL